ncbi:MAG TPA: hypothetical protein VER96_12170 [Polyangiaceae bacterium]|nr:hypothetical protein [Polyangiaceae bacterium]
MNGRKLRGLGVVMLSCAACAPVAEPRVPATVVAAAPPPAPAQAPEPASAAVDSNGPAPQTIPKSDTAVAASEDIAYRAELEDRSITLQQQVRHLTWTCENGACSAKGPTLQISGKSCVMFGATVGAVVTHFQFGEQQLDAEQLAYCQSTLRKLQSEGKFSLIAQQRQRAAAQPSGISAGQSYFEITTYVGQTRLSDGSLRFVFMDGTVALVRPDRTLFRFDAERRLSDSGRFVRWHSVGGEYTGTDPLLPEVLDRCSRTNGGIAIEPWQIRQATTFLPACDPHRADFRAIFTRENLPAAALTAARATLFEAPYANDARWKQAARGASDPVVVGSAQSQPGYFKEPARDLLEKVQTAVQGCSRYASDPTAQIRGEVMLLLNAFGTPKSVLVRRTTYPDPERFSVCIEQRLMRQKFQSTNDVNVRVPFQLGDR